MWKRRPPIPSAVRRWTNEKVHQNELEENQLPLKEIFHQGNKIDEKFRAEIHQTLLFNFTLAQFSLKKYKSDESFFILVNSDLLSLRNIFDSTKLYVYAVTIRHNFKINKFMFENISFDPKLPPAPTPSSRVSPLPLIVWRHYEWSQSGLTVSILYLQVKNPLRSINTDNNY